MLLSAGALTSPFASLQHPTSIEQFPEACHSLAHMAIGYRQGISIAILILYIPALAIAIFLSIRHGFRRASGWRFMIVFTLARVLGSCLELATINQPKNYSLYIGYATLINVALSPLQLVAFGLLSRVISVGVFRCPSTNHVVPSALQNSRSRMHRVSIAVQPR